MEHVDLAGVSVGAHDLAGWVDHLTACIEGAGQPHHHVSLNAGKWVAMRRDPHLRGAVQRATSIAADGVGIVAAARAMGTPLPGRAPGADVASALVDRAADRGWRVALLGAGPEVLSQVDRQLRERSIAVVFSRHGYAEPDTATVAAEIRATKPHLLLVALGTPRAERFIDQYRHDMDVPLAMGVGGTFDVWAGRARRAPGVVQQLGLEWAWRFAGAPATRFERAILRSLVFVAAIARGQRMPDGGGS